MTVKVNCRGHEKIKRTLGQTAHLLDRNTKLHPIWIHEELEKSIAHSGAVMSSEEELMCDLITNLKSAKQHLNQLEWFRKQVLWTDEVRDR